MARGKKPKNSACEVLKPEQADKMFVHIQGFSGLHPVRTGIAYWYRGRYLYGSVGNPIDPQPFATKGKLVLSGNMSDSVPKYDERDPTLKEEYTVASLYKAMWDQGYFDPPSQDQGELESNDQEELDAKDETNVVDVNGNASGMATAINQPQEGYGSGRGGEMTAYADVPLPVGSGRPTSRNETSGHLTASNSTQSLTQLLFRYPHDASHFLAASAPGSRFESRNVSALPTPMATPPMTPVEEVPGFQLTISVPHSRGGSRTGAFHSYSHSRQTSLHLRNASKHSTHSSRHSSGHSTGHPSCQPSGARSVQGSGDESGNDGADDLDLEPRSLQELVELSVPATPSLPRQNSLPPLSLPSSRNISRAGSPLLFRALTPSNTDMRTLLHYRTNRLGGEEKEPPSQLGVSSLKRYNTEPLSTDPISRSGSALGSAGLLAPPSIYDLDHRSTGSQRSLTPNPPTRREQSKIAYEASKSSSPYLLHRRSSSYGGGNAITDSSLHDKASLALNEAYNAARATKCPLHGEDCDGETVTSPHLTERTRLGKGFKDLYPTVESMGRMMIDWVRMVKEEKDAMTAAAKGMGMKAF